MSAKMGQEGTEQGQHQQRCHKCIALGSEREEMAGDRVSSEAVQGWIWR